VLNRCEFIGNLGADPEVRNLPSGGKVVNMRLAVTEAWRDKNTGERKERTEWVNIVIFGDGLAKVAETYLKKGSKIYVAGQMQTRRWQDQAGADRYSTEIVLQGHGGQLEMLDGKPQSGGGQHHASAPAGDDDGPMPF
jgi:single-strand DNA-binding protein